MADSKKIDCISPNTGVAFDQWEETGPAEFQSALDKVSSASFSDLSEVSSRRKALFAISNAIEKNRNEFETIIDYGAENLRLSVFNNSSENIYSSQLQNSKTEKNQSFF